MKRKKSKGKAVKIANEATRLTALATAKTLMLL